MNASPETILAFMSDGHTRRQNEIESEFTEPSSVGEILLHLMDHGGHLHEPNGDYRGYQITESGRAELARLRSERQTIAEKPKQKAMFA